MINKTLLIAFIEFIEDFILMFLGSDIFYCLALVSALAVAIIIPFNFCGLGAKK